MSKYLIFSDLHLHNWSYGASYVDGWNSRLIHQRRLLREIYEDAVQSKVDRIMFCGDLFHTHGKLDVYCLSVASVLKFWTKLLYIIPGNHDFASRDGRVNALSCFAHYNEGLYIGNLGFHPYTEDKKELELFLNRAPTDALIFLHQGVQGVPIRNFVLPNETLEPSMIPDRIQQAFAGHYHTHKQVSDKLTIVGAPQQHTWADEGEDRGWLIYDEEDNSIVPRKSKAPRFLSLPYSKVEEEDVANSFIRISEFDGKDEKEYRDYLMKEKKVCSVEFTSTTARNSSYSFKEDLSSIEEIISQYEKENEIPEECQKIGKELRRGNYEALRKGTHETPSLKS